MNAFMPNSTRRLPLPLAQNEMPRYALALYAMLCIDSGVIVALFNSKPMPPNLPQPLPDACAAYMVELAPPIWGRNGPPVGGCSFEHPESANECQGPCRPPIMLMRPSSSSKV